VEEETKHHPQEQHLRAAKEAVQDEKPGDDEISIDFSTIKKWFSEKAPEKKHEDGGHTHHTHDHHGQSSEGKSAGERKDDEISIDFRGMGKKLKGMFTEGGSSKEPKERGEDDVSVDWGKAASFLRKYGIFFLALIPIILAINVRMHAAGLPITDQWAQDTVFNGIRSQIAGQITAQYPNLPAQNRDALVNAEFQKQLQQNWPQISQTIAAYSNEYKKHFQDDQGIPYMPDIDTYYWMRYAENILDHGHPGDELRDGRPYDALQLAPLGRFVFPDMFPSYFLAYFHGFLTVFNSQLTLVQSMSLYPVLVAALSTLLIFLIALKISNPVGGLFAASMFAVNTAFLGRSLYGHADNDGWVLFFPLLITWLFFEIFERDKLWKVAAIGAAAGISVGFFSFAWGGGWWFIFDLIMGMAALSFFYLIIRDFKKLREQKLAFFRQRDEFHLVMGMAVFVLASAIVVSFFRGFSQFLGAALGPLSFTTIKEPVTASLWPNVLTTVAELNTGSLNQAIQSVGGKFLFYLGVAGIILALLKRDAQGRKDVRFGILLALWFVATCYATIKGIRFTLLLAPAYSVAFGAAIGMLYALFSRWLSRELHVHKAISASLLVILFSLLLIGPVKAAYGVAEGDLPIMNDAWWHALTAIKEESQPNAIITSWWDFGHHFKEIAKRPVTFDGTTQTFPPAYWVGKLFMTGNEKQALGILRMLDCSGGGKPVTILYEETKNMASSIQMINDAGVLPKGEAQQMLEKKGIRKETAAEVVSLTHCSPPEGIVIASNDMIGKSGVWGHFGSWDFERADIWYNVRPETKEEGVAYLMSKYNYSRDKAENTYFEVSAIQTEEEGNRWVAPWPGYASSISCSRTSPQEQLFRCSNGFLFNYTSKDAYALSQNGVVRPKGIAYATREGVEIRQMDQMNGSTVDAGLTFIPENRDTFTAIISSPELTGSMFTVMFYMDGHGLRYFEPFFKERGLIGTDVKVYRTNWNGGKAHIEQKYVDALDQIENASVSAQPEPTDTSSAGENGDPATGESGNASVSA